MEKPVISLKLHSGEVTVDGKTISRILLPNGCIGIMMVFDNKKTAREYWGKNVGVKEIEIKSKEGAEYDAT